MGSLVLTGDTSGSVTVAVPAVAGTNTATFPAATGTVMVAGNMPAFSATGTTQSAPTNNTDTKLIFGTKTGTFGFDTNSNYDAVTNYRFTPTVAGYYQVNGEILGQGSVTCTGVLVGIYKNGSVFKWGNWSYPASTTAGRVTVSALIYMNGSTDYLELYGYVAGTGTMSFPGTTAVDDYFQAVLVRGA